MENLIKNIDELRENILNTQKILDIEGSKSKLRDLNREMNKKDFWNDQESAVLISKEAEEIEKEINEWEVLSKEVRELEELTVIAQKEKDNTLEKELNKKYKELGEKFKKLEFLVLFSEKFDINNVILSIHAGTGGVDAQDWTQILERMFLRFAEKKDWKAELVERTIGNEAGIKSATYNIKGRWVYGNLKSENGVHRLVRISPFDAESMRHTSFALVEVIPEFPETEDIKIKDEDLRIDVYKSSGPGGQSVNTTDSAVRIVYKPSNITVTCQTERSQHQNKETAIKILKSKLLLEQIKTKEKQERKMRGEAQIAEWGKQIRSYVMQPYKMVKDHRTNYETQNIDAVLDGDLEKFIEEYLKWIRK